MNDYLTTEDAANYLKVSPSRVRQLILEGRIKSKKIGRDHIIDKSDILNFAKHGKKKRGRPSEK